MQPRRAPRDHTDQWVATLNAANDANARLMGLSPPRAHPATAQGHADVFNAAGRRNVQLNAEAEADARAEERRRRPRAAVAVEVKRRGGGPPRSRALADAPPAGEDGSDAEWYLDLETITWRRRDAPSAPDRSAAAAGPAPRSAAGPSLPVPGGSRPVGPGALVFSTSGQANGQAKRGPGRPRVPDELKKKPKYAPTGRPRGRPPLPPHLRKPSGPTGRPRGRPRKSVPGGAGAAVQKRGRGRPRKHSVDTRGVAAGVGLAAGGLAQRPPAMALVSLLDIQQPLSPTLLIRPKPLPPPTAASESEGSSLTLVHAQARSRPKSASLVPEVSKAVALREEEEEGDSDVVEYVDLELWTRDHETALRAEKKAEDAQKTAARATGGNVAALGAADFNGPSPFVSSSKPALQPASLAQDSAQGVRADRSSRATNSALPSRAPSASFESNTNKLRWRPPQGAPESRPAGAGQIPALRWTSPQGPGLDRRTSSRFPNPTRIPAPQQQLAQPYMPLVPPSPHDLYAQNRAQFAEITVVPGAYVQPGTYQYPPARHSVPAEAVYQPVGRLGGSTSGRAPQQAAPQVAVPPAEAIAELEVDEEVAGVAAAVRADDVSVPEYQSLEDLAASLASYLGAQPAQRASGPFFVGCYAVVVDGKTKIADAFVRKIATHLRDQLRERVGCDCFKCVSSLLHYTRNKVLTGHDRTHVEAMSASFAHGNRSVTLTFGCACTYRPYEKAKACEGKVHIGAQELKDGYPGVKGVRVTVRIEH